ncbi:MAG: hypothetical protein UIM26_08815 [Longicatena sp.]|nr:hypothetical protein [Longicatena sp.]
MKPYQLLWIDHSNGNTQSFYQGFQLIGELQYDEEILLQVVWSYYEKEEGIILYVNDETLLNTKPLEIASMVELDHFGEVCDQAIFTYELEDQVEPCYVNDFNNLLNVMHDDLTKRQMLHPQQFPFTWKIK